MTEGDFITTQAAARRLGISMRALYELINQRELSVTKVGRHVMLSGPEVDQFLERGGPPPKLP